MAPTVDFDQGCDLSPLTSRSNQ